MQQPQRIRVKGVTALHRWHTSSSQPNKLNSRCAGNSQQKQPQCFPAYSMTPPAHPCRHSAAAHAQRPPARDSTSPAIACGRSLTYRGAMSLLASLLKSCCFFIPTPVQQRTWPAIASIIFLHSFTVFPSIQSGTVCTPLQTQCCSTSTGVCLQRTANPHNCTTAHLAALGLNHLHAHTVLQHMNRCMCVIFKRQHA
jgi:hypothetical protein